ncbi:MAG: MBL fold metallo-hydrolase [Brevinema sp.]
MKSSLLKIFPMPLVFGQERQICSNILFISIGIGNIVSIQTDEGTVLIDTSIRDALPDLIKRIPSATYVITTHRHFDHIGGNDYYGDRGATIIAHRNTAKYLAETGSLVDTPAGQPTILVDTEYKLTVGREKMELIHLPNAHTDGDLAVFFPNKNYIHISDVTFGKNSYNNMDIAHGATIDGLIAATKKIIDLVDHKTKITGGHGALLTQKDLKNNLEMYEIVRNRVKILKNQGKTLEEVVTLRPTIDFDEKYEKKHEWKFITGGIFTELVYKSL